MSTVQTMRVVLRDLFDKQTKKAIRKEAEMMANTLQHKKFHRKVYEFSADFGGDYPEEVEDEFAYGASDLFGWLPKDILCFYVATSDEQVRQILDSLALHFAREFNGFVGALSPPKNAIDQEKKPSHEPYEFKLPSGIPGKLFYIPNPDTFYSYGCFYGDLDYFEWQLKESSTGRIK